MLEDFNLNGEGTEPSLPTVDEERVEDALDLALSEAPQGSSRDCYRYARERIFPLIERLEDEGERGPTLDDVAKKLKLGKKDLRDAFAGFEENRREQESAEHDDEGRVHDDLAPEPGSEHYERALELLTDPDILTRAARTMELLGHVGEQLAKMLAFVCHLCEGGSPHPAFHARRKLNRQELLMGYSPLASAARAGYKEVRDLRQSPVPHRGGSEGCGLIPAGGGGLRGRRFHNKGASIRPIP
jgi:hypothetical protein